MRGRRPRSQAVALRPSPARNSSAGARARSPLAELHEDVRRLGTAPGRGPADPSPAARARGRARRRRARRRPSPRPSRIRARRDVAPARPGSAASRPRLRDEGVRPRGAPRPSLRARTSGGDEHAAEPAREALLAVAARPRARPRRQTPDPPRPAARAPTAGRRGCPSPGTSSNVAFAARATSTPSRDLVEAVALRRARPRRADVDQSGRPDLVEHRGPRPSPAPPRRPGSPRPRSPRASAAATAGSGHTRLRLGGGQRLDQPPGLGEVLHRRVAVSARARTPRRAVVSASAAPSTSPGGQQLVPRLLEQLEVGLAEERRAPGRAGGAAGRVAVASAPRSSSAARKKRDGGVIGVQRERAVAGVGQRRPRGGREGLGAPSGRLVSSSAWR